MSPRFSPDPTKATSGFLTYPKGSYRVQLGDPISFYFDKGENGPNHGVQFSGKIISTDVVGFADKPFPLRLFQHTEGALNYSKSIQMAALGCKKDEEFNQKYGAEDWTYNSDDKSSGNGWHLMKGQVVDIEVGEVKINGKTGDEQTGNMTFRPVLG